MAAPQSGSSRAFGIRQRLRPTGRERRRRLCVDFTRERTDVRGKAAQKWPCRLDRACPFRNHLVDRSEEHTSELQSLMRISYAAFCLKKQKYTQTAHTLTTTSYN